jgi:DNA-binding MarR family transcriptional regulator
MTLSSAETPLRPPSRVAQELVKSNGFLLARLGLMYKAGAIARMEQAGFELYDYSVLALLAEGTRETQATIADALSLDPSRLVALLDSLEERGMIGRQRDPQDRRRHVVSITDAGQGELERLRVMMKDYEDEFFAGMSMDERKSLHELLSKLATCNDPRCAFDPSAPSA